jgi:hypothetical protein
VLILLNVALLVLPSHSCSRVDSEVTDAPVITHPAIKIINQVKDKNTPYITINHFYLQQVITSPITPVKKAIIPILTSIPKAPFLKF